MVEQKTHNGSPDVTNLFRLEVLESRNFAWERKGNTSTVGTEVNILGTDRVEADINFPSSLSPPHSPSCCITFSIA